MKDESGCSSPIEISFIHAEDHAAGEMKHGPIALIDDGVPVIVVALSRDRSAAGRSLVRVDPEGGAGAAARLLAAVAKTSGSPAISPRACRLSSQDRRLWPSTHGVYRHSPAAED
jgi:glutamine---fructose-6-phosphate transaminase (isomerizing)